MGLRVLPPPAGTVAGTAVGGVLAGTLPNPSFAADMATQAELDAAVADLETEDANLSSAVAAKVAKATVPVAFTVAASDESTAITTGNGKVTFRMPYAMTLTDVRGSLSTASSSGVVTIDINEDGSTILSTKLTIDANEKTSTTAATPAVISDSALADDAEITIDFDGAGTGAKGVKVEFIGTRVQA